MIRKKLLVMAVSSIVVAGCSSTKTKDDMFTSLEVQPDSYHKQVTSENRYKTEVMLLRRQLDELRMQLSSLTKSKETIEHNLAGAELRSDELVSNTQSAESERVTVLQEATLNAQQVVASNSIVHVQRQAEIDAELESKLAIIEADADRLMANIKANLKIKKARLKSDATTEKAAAEQVLLSKNAGVVAPIMTGRDVYVRTEKKNGTNHVIHKNPNGNKALIVAEAKTVVTPQVHIASPLITKVAYSNQVSPVIVEQPTKQVFDVVYEYSDKGSWKIFNRMLKAHGVKDMWAIPSKGKFYTYVGRFNKASHAERRKSYLAKVLHSDHAIIKKKQVLI